MYSEEEIQFLFTLRFNPNRKVSLQQRPLLDFIPGDTEQEIMENLIKDALIGSTNNLTKAAISLSAGVDSNVVLALLREVRPNLKLHAYISEGLEQEDAVELALKNDIPFTIVKPESVLLNIPKYVKMSGEPRWNAYHHVIAEKAKADGFDMLFTGDGGDELFAGYVFRYQELMKYLDEGFPRAYLMGHKNDYLLDQTGFFKHFRWETIYEYIRQYKSSFLHPIEWAMRADFNGKFIKDLVPTSQAIQRWHGIQISSPFTKQKVIEYALRMDFTKKITDDYSLGKLPLRKILDDRGIKISNKKMGFTYDLVNDWNNKKKRSIYLHPRTFDIIEYKWWENNSKETEDYRIINKIYQTICLSEYYKLHG